MAKARSGRPTPEEQLLNLIEKGGGSPGAVKLTRKRRRISVLLIFKKPVSFCKIRLSGIIAGLKSGLREPNLKLLNKCLLVIAALLLVFLIADFIFKQLDIEVLYDRAKVEKRRVLLEEIKAEVRPFLHYLEMVQRREIFSQVKLKKAEEEPVIKKADLSELAKDLSLVGIAWGKNPQAMVEDEKAGKTYFLRAGESINEFMIEDVLKDKVILSYKGETIELM